MTDREYLTGVWQQAWGKALDEELAKGVPVDDWRRAGRVTKEKPNKEDLVWWFAAGLEQTVQYADWLAASGWTVAVMPDGRPAIELKLTVHFGGVPVKAFIDAAFDTGAETPVVDFKSGSHVPEPAQLGLYAAMLNRAYGIEVPFGSYYMTRRADLSGAHDLTRFSPAFWDRTFEQMAAGVNGRIFVPRISRDCGFCDVSQFCLAAGGPDASEWDDDSPWQVPGHFSWSQLQAWADCGVKYKLSRLARVPTKPAVWFVAGTALHAAIERINRDSLTGA